MVAKDRYGVATVLGTSVRRNSDDEWRIDVGKLTQEAIRVRFVRALRDHDLRRAGWSTWCRHHDLRSSRVHADDSSNLASDSDLHIVIVRQVRPGDRYLGTTRDGARRRS